MWTRSRPQTIPFPVAIFFLLVASTADAWSPPRHTGLDYALNFADIPYFYSGTTTYQNSSRDPSGANSDGLGCERWLYHDGEYVILDEPGPGCIEDIWMTAIPPGNIRIYFDNETTPRVDLNLSQLFSGTAVPFLTPLVGNDNVSSGGYYCKVPMAFQERVRVALTDPPCYWHVLWNRYPAGTPVTTYTNALDVSPFVNMLNAAGTDPKPTVGNQTQTGSIVVPTGEGRTMFSHTGTGSIAALKIDPFPADESVLMNVWVSIFFDGAENAQVQAPIGLFFGCGTTELNVRGLPVGMSNSGSYYCYFPMPFWESVRIDLYNGRQGDVTVPFEVQFRTEAYGDDAGYFCARYKREHATSQGLDYLILETNGTGHYVGASVLFTAPGGGFGFLEGDERIYVDGSLAPQIYGTGTEDYFEGGYYFNRGAFSLPLHGMPHQDNNGYARFNMYRFHLGDRIPFTNHIRVGMEHGGVNEVDGWYSSVAYYYWKPQLSSFTTDILDIGDLSSESQHSYSRVGETWSGPLSAQYEGDFDTVSYNDTGCRFQTSSRFDLALSPANRGAFLRRRTDQGSGRQRGNVLVNQSFLSEWDHLYFNGFKRWHDETLFVPGDWAHGRDSMRARIESGDWNEFRYTVKSLVDVNELLTWEAEDLTPVASSGRPYANVSMSDVNWVWGGSTIAEYQASAPGDYVTLRVPVAEGGWYGVWADLSRGDDTGVVQLSVNGQPALETADLYDYFYRRGPIASPGIIIELNQGTVDIRLEVKGRNPSSSSYRIRVDRIYLAKLDPPVPPPATPTGTPPTPTPLPTATPLPPSILHNGGFEDGFSPENVGLHWTRYNDPGYGGPYADRTDIRRSGAHAQGWRLPVPAQDFRYAGVYQRIPVTPGRQYRFTAFAYSIYNGPEQNSWDNIILRLGVDPLGDTAFRSGSVNYAEFNSAHNVWHQQSVTVAAAGYHITVFLDGWRKWRSGVDDAWAIFDDVSFEDLSPPMPSPTPTFTRTPTPAATVFTPSPTKTSVTVPTTTPVSGPNLLSNPGFEFSGGASHPGWTHSLFGTNGLFPHPGSAHEGSQWASYSYGGGGTSADEIYQSVSVTPGHTYYVSAFVGVGGNDGTITASLRWWDGAYGGSGGTTLDSISWTWPDDQSPWIHLSGSVVPTKSALTFIVHADIQGWGAGMNLDDCALIDLAPVTPTAPPTETATPTPSPEPTHRTRAHWQLR